MLYWLYDCTAVRPITTYGREQWGLKLWRWCWTSCLWNFAQEWTPRLQTTCRRPITGILIRLLQDMGRSYRPMSAPTDLKRSSDHQVRKSLQRKMSRNPSGIVTSGTRTDYLQKDARKLVILPDPDAYVTEYSSQRIHCLSCWSTCHPCLRAFFAFVTLPWNSLCWGSVN